MGKKRRSWGLRGELRSRGTHLPTPSTLILGTGPHTCWETSIGQYLLVFRWPGKSSKRLSCQVPYWPVCPLPEEGPNYLLYQNLRPPHPPERWLEVLAFLRERWGLLSGHAPVCTRVLPMMLSWSLRNTQWIKLTVPSLSERKGGKSCPEWLLCTRVASCMKPSLTVPPSGPPPFPQCL